ncbi:MAG: hypothetical protein JWP01_3552 [Myxococcales bacterium]|nr:hypothetical protein [Myxococcales bacterium]
MANMTTATDDLAPERDLAPLTIGSRIDALVTTVKAQPLAAVGVGIVVGYVLARLLRSTRRV